MKIGLAAPLRTFPFILLGICLVSTNGATLIVTTTADTNNFCAPGGCSLREAIAAAADGDEIVFASPLFDSPQTITLTPIGMGGLGGLVINKSITITGGGADLLTIGRPAPSDHLDHNRMQIFNLGSNTTVTLSGITISGGLAANSGAGIQSSSVGVNTTLIGCHITNNYALSTGGGIRTDSPMTIINSTISKNGTDGIGGGIGNFANLTITNSTITGNTAGSGGGIYNFKGIVTITSSTITDNQASSASSASGIDRAGGSLTIRNAIIAGNRNNSTMAEVHGSSTSSHNQYVSQGYNVIGNVGDVTDFNQPGDQTGVTNPMLATLANNGGPTPTHALLSGSPAIDKGNSFGLTSDQRDLPRPSDDPSIPPAAGGDNSDIGAFELQLPKVRITSITRIGGGFLLQGVGVPSTVHRIQATASLLQPFDPNPIGTPASDANGNSSSRTTPTFRSAFIARCILSGTHQSFI